MKRFLLLEDGTQYEGEAFGSTQTVTGELVFNTGMTGYQESLTDPSYTGQILMFTYPLIGNYGIDSEVSESALICANAVVVNEVSRLSARNDQNTTLEEFMIAHHMPGIKNIDTRMVTKHIREAGVMRAAILDEVTTDSLAELKKAPSDSALVNRIATKQAYPNPAIGKRVVVIDFGLKYSILRELGKRNCDVMVVPPSTSAEAVMNYHPDGVLLSNGPGNPEDVDQTVLTMIQAVQKLVPLFGICLGHQLLALANGAKTQKLKFGHRGFNHPVKNLTTGRIDFTSQNHGYAVDRDSLKQTDLQLTHEELNDHSVEGLRHKDLPVFSVQFHPDAAPGPHDANDVFDEFIQLMNAK
ncbi:carbamoyl phosphate synthase small subunit [Pediococcus argentinicus]|uniref:carbamoyl phosphate synthase small subunit n=1 Tax=Pediococcus argentinicus TaxID=480391 RepID=UPI00338FF028